MQYKLFLFILSLLACPVPILRADVINLNLAQWETEGSVDFEDSTPTLKTGAAMSSSALGNSDFEFPDMAQALSIELFVRIFGVTDEPGEGIAIPGSFHLSYLDLVAPNPDQGIDYDKHFDLMFTGLDVDHPDGSFFMDLEIGNSAGRAGALWFDLIDENDDFDVEVTIRNISITTAAMTPVPEPSTFLLIGAGLITVLGLVRRRQDTRD